MSYNEIAVASTWVVNFLYFACLIPQIVLDYRLKSTRGVNDIMLFGYLSGYLAFLFYVFFLNLPLSYKIFVPLTVLGLLVLVFQRFYYSSIAKNLLLFISYITLISIFLCIIFFTEQTQWVGNLAGWITSVLWSTSKIPQVIEIYEKKSVEGLSFAFITILNLGVLVELLAAYILDLPVQTKVNNIGALFLYLIFCIGFWKYSKIIFRPL